MSINDTWMRSLCLGMLLVGCGLGDPLGDLTPNLPEPTLTGVVLEPAEAVLAPGQTQLFGAYGVMSNGNRNNSVSITYSATGGTLALERGGALYTAGQVPGTYSVSAETPSGGGGTFSDVSPVTITAP